MKASIDKLKFTIRHCLIVPLALALLAATTSMASATTWWVYASAATGGTGTQSSPFKTIGAAVAVAQTSDTINVEDGTYPETVNLTHGGTSTAPFTLQSAPGQVGSISGFVSIPSTSWSVYSGTGAATVYTATASWPVRDLFTSATHDSIGKTKWETVSTCTGTPGGTYTMTMPSLGLNFGGNVKSSFIYVDQFHSHGSYNTLNGYLSYYINSMTDNGTTTTITFTDTGDAAYIDPGADTVTVCNHPSLVGENTWCYSGANTGSTTLYYAPVNTGNLSETQSRSLDICLNVRNLNYVNVTGIVVGGALDEGIDCGSSTNVNFTKCTAYDCGGADGILLDTDTNTTVKGCVVTANANGMAVVTGTNVAVEQSLICYDDEDGCDVTARSGLETNGFTVEQCYFHNHQGVGHADDLQFDTTTVNALVDSSCLSFSGQNIMCGGVTGTLSNNVFLGSDADSVQGNATWTMKNNTWLFSNYGVDGTSGDSIVNSLFYHAILTYYSETSSDYNLFWNNNSYNDPVAVTYPPWTAYYTSTLGSLYTATGYEEYSTGVNPQLTNVPNTAGMVYDTGGVNTPPATQILVSALGSSHLSGYFNVGDVIEVNGDGVAHTITATTTGTSGTTLTVSPPNNAGVWRNGLVWDWPAGTTNLTVDTRPKSGSPALGGGQNGVERGSNINLVQFAAGEFDGTGTVNIPAISGNITNIWTHDTDYPYYGIAP